MLSRRPFRVKECTVGTGSACGAIFLNENFKKLLYEKVGQDILTPRCLADAVKNFEEGLKQDFDPFSNDCDDEFEIPLPGIPDNESLGIIAGYITLPKLTRSSAC